jgi:hypothetical protein
MDEEAAPSPGVNDNLEPESDEDLGSEGMDEEASLGIKVDLEPDKAPPCLDGLLDDLEQQVRQWVTETGNFKTDQIDRIIRRRTHELNAEDNTPSIRRKLQVIIQQAEDRKRSLHEKAVVQTMLWGDTRSVHSLCYCKVPVGEDERATASRRIGSGHGLNWWAEVWVSASERKQVLLTTKYVKHLLTAHAFRDSRYLRNKFSVVAKYHRQQTVDSVAFVSIKRISSDRYEMTDSSGCCALVDKAWVGRTPRLRHTALSLVDGQKKKCPGGRNAASCPVIVYMNEDERCLTRSCASALHYLGHTKEAEEFGWARHVDGHAFEVARDLAKKLFKNRNGKPVSFRKAHYEPFNSLHRRNNPILAELKAVTRGNGKPIPTHIGHVVCFVGDYIFDSNQTTALPINPRSLNQICQAVEPGTTYAGIKWSREIVLVGCRLPPRTLGQA